MEGPTRGFRKKARLAVRRVEKKGRARIGFRELRDGRFVAHIESSVILDASPEGMIPEMAPLVDSLSIASNVPQIEIAAGYDGAALVLRFASREPPSPEVLDPLRAFEREQAWSLWLQPKELEFIHDLWGRLLFGVGSGLSCRLDEGALQLHFGSAKLVHFSRL